MNKIKIILAIVIAAILVISIIRDPIIKSTITVVISQIVGAPVHIEGFSLNIFKQSIKISGFKIYNPRGFSRSVLLYLPKINIVYDLGALFKNQLHLLNTEIELKEMVLEKNSQGQLNIDALKVVRHRKMEGAKPSKQMLMQLDMLQLGIGRVIVKDHSAGKEPFIKVYDVNIYKNYNNITSFQQLAALALEPMKAAGIQGTAIYGAALLTGVAVFPVGIAETFVGRDSAQQDFAASFDKAFKVSLAVLKKMGKVNKQDKPGGIINAEINSAQVVLKVKRKPDRKTEVVVSARKYFFPEPQIAGGILYEISEKLK